jgi:hypothetical protein
MNERAKSDGNISTRGKANDVLHGSGGITPAILNLDTLYAVREQLHGQAAFFLGEIIQIYIGRAL